MGDIVLNWRIEGQGEVVFQDTALTIWRKKHKLSNIKSIPPLSQVHLPLRRSYVSVLCEHWPRNTSCFFYRNFHKNAGCEWLGPVRSIPKSSYSSKPSWMRDPLSQPSPWGCQSSGKGTSSFPGLHMIQSPLTPSSASFHTKASCFCFLNCRLTPDSSFSRLSISPSQEEH